MPYKDKEKRAEYERKYRAEHPEQVREAHRRHYYANHEETKQKLRRDNKLIRNRRRKLIVGTLGGKCVACGYNSCDAALEFHHLDPTDKKISLSTRDMQLAWEKIEKELEKCILLCANCHRELHAGFLKLENLGDVTHRQV